MLMLSDFRGLHVLPGSLAALLLLTAGTPAAAQDEESAAALADSIWKPPTEVVQSRRVEKARAVELVALFGVIPNDAFLVYLPVGLRAAYHFTERWALELSFEYNLSVDTGLRDFLQSNDAELRARIRDRQQLRAAASAVWSPLYGKLAAGHAILHFDGYLHGGAGILRLAAEPDVGQGASVRPDFHLGAGVRAFLGSRFVLRLELRQYLFARPGAAGQSGGVGAASEVDLCAGVLLGGRR
jgi:outer membrane beta-barrel protein